MKALSIKQPWTELILEGKKTIEIRSWKTKYRGYFLIHSSKRPDTYAMDFFGFSNLPRGYIVGYAKLMDIIEYNSEMEFLRDKYKHFSISIKKEYPVYGFVITDVHRIKPIPYKGRLSFFEVSDSLVEE